MILWRSKVCIPSAGIMGRENQEHRPSGSSSSLEGLAWGAAEQMSVADAEMVEVPDPMVKQHVGHVGVARIAFLQLPVDAMQLPQLQKARGAKAEVAGEDLLQRTPGDPALSCQLRDGDGLLFLRREHIPATLKDPRPRQGRATRLGGSLGWIVIPAEPTELSQPCLLYTSDAADE